MGKGKNDLPHLPANATSTGQSLLLYSVLCCLSEQCSHEEQGVRIILQWWTLNLEKCVLLAGCLKCFALCCSFCFLQKLTLFVFILAHSFAKCKYLLKNFKIYFSVIYYILQ